MNPMLRLVPLFCYAIAAIMFVSQAFVLIRAIVRGYDYGYAVDLTAGMELQIAGIWLQVVAKSFAWFAFGLLAKLLIRSIDDWQAAVSELKLLSSGISNHA